MRAAWERHPLRYEAIFDHIESLTAAGADAVRDGALEDLGELMNLCHGYLNALQVSTPELEEMIHARARTEQSAQSSPAAVAEGRSSPCARERPSV